MAGPAKWSEIAPAASPAGWNELLLQTRDYTVFQSHGWGELKREAGWLPVRLAACEGSKVFRAAQCLVKKLPLGVALVWVPGGPAFHPAAGSSGVDADVAGLFAALRERFKHLVLKIDSNVASDPRLSFDLARVAYRPSPRINSGFSIVFDLSQGAEAALAGTTSKHRYYVKKSAKSELTWRAGSADLDIDAFASLHGEIVASKSFVQSPASRSDLVRMRKHLGESGLTILTGMRDGVPVTSCLTLDFGKKSFYFLAATGKAGRDLGAGYAMVPKLFEVLAAKGVTEFDFGGLAPANPAAAGVNHFKQGFGGKLTEYLGEWEMASGSRVSAAVALAMKLKGIGT